MRASPREHYADAKGEQEANFSRLKQVGLDQGDRSRTKASQETLSLGLHVFCTELLSTVQNITLISKVGTGFNNRLPGVLYRINKLRYILHLDVFSHLTFESCYEIRVRGKYRRHINWMYASLLLHCRLSTVGVNTLSCQDAK
jgi:hypothetical protein